MDIELARSKVQGPAIGLIVFAILSFLGQIFSIVYGLVAGGGDLTVQLLNAGVPAEFADIVAKASVTGVGCLGILFAAVILFAGLKMRGLQSYGLTIAGSILALIPCNCCCCWIGLGVGIWSLVTLSREDVKAAFQAEAAQAM